MKLSCKLISLLEAKSSIPDEIYSNDILMDLVRSEIKNMAWEIDQSEAGKRKNIQVVNKEDGKGYIKNINVSTKSTFPEYLQDIFNGSGTKKKFLSASKRGKGKVWDRIALVAIERLKHGYKNKHGFDTPDMEFKDELENPVPF